jgi:hypothetical protein
LAVQEHPGSLIDDPSEFEDARRKAGIFVTPAV